MAEARSAWTLGCVVEAPDRLTAYFAEGADNPCAGMRLPMEAPER